MDFNTGLHGKYYWLETHETSLPTLIKKLPELFLGKFLIISCFDGNEYVPKKDDFIKGWKVINKMTYTEFITRETLKKNIFDNNDQWLLTEKEESINKVEYFVNYTYFSLIDWELEINNLDSADDKNFILKYSLQRNRLRDIFWSQIEAMNLKNFIYDGSKFIFVTTDPEEIIKIKNLRI